MGVDKIPHLIEFPKIGNSEKGLLTIAESYKNVPFDIKRVFWVGGFSEITERGNHAHKETQQILICQHGVIDFFAIMPDGIEYNFRIDQPNIGIYVPAAAWHKMLYQPGTIQLVLASSYYDESDYFRMYDDYKKYYLAW